jgi:hypothetical protein
MCPVKIEELVPHSKGFKDANKGNLLGGTEKLKKYQVGNNGETRSYVTERRKKRASSQWAFLALPEMPSANRLYPR